MSSENISVVRQGYEAFARGDFAAIFALLHPDIEIVQTTLLPWGGQYRGHAGAREFFGKLAANIESNVEPLEYIAAGDSVAVIGRLRGKVRANGNTFDIRIVHIWTVKNGQCTRFEAYIDTPAMLQALGG